MIEKELNKKKELEKEISLLKEEHNNNMKVLN
jgi:hypothetical protein